MLQNLEINFIFTFIIQISLTLFLNFLNFIQCLISSLFVKNKLSGRFSSEINGKFNGKDNVQQMNYVIFNF